MSTLHSRARCLMPHCAASITCAALSPQCELCANASHYFDNNDATCRACGHVGTYAAGLCAIGFSFLLVAGGMLALLTRHELPKQKLARKIMELGRWSAAVWTSAGMRNKLKCAVGCCRDLSVRSLTTARMQKRMEDHGRPPSIPTAWCRQRHCCILCGAGSFSGCTSASPPCPVTSTWRHLKALSG